MKKNIKLSCLKDEDKPELRDECVNYCPKLGYTCYGTTSQTWEGCVNRIKKLALLNTSIITTAGSYELKDISLETAKELVSQNELDSAIGHASTAEIMTTLLGVKIPVNRQMFQQQVGQEALVFKLNGRPEEGKILAVDEIEKMGYKFQLMTRKR